MDREGERIRLQENTERRRRVLINFAYYAVIAVLYYLFFSYGIHYIMPFVVAFLIAMILERPISAISKHPHFPRKAVSGVMLVLFYGIIVTLLSLIVNRLLSTVFAWFGELPNLYRDYIEPAATKLLLWYDHNIAVLLPGFQEDVESNMGDILSALSGIFSGISSSVVKLAQDFVISAPSRLFSLLFGIIASVYFCLDYPALSYFLDSQVKEDGSGLASEIKGYISQGIGQFIVSYFKILCITFAELLLGFLIIGQGNALLFAFIIAFFDILPALGVGTILWPWALIAYLNGEPIKAIQLMVIYTVITVVRRVIEPLIVGDSIGLGPSSTIISMYLGIRVFGALGLVIGPFTAIVIKNLNDLGRIHIYKSVYLEEEPHESEATKALRGQISSHLKKRTPKKTNRRNR